MPDTFANALDFVLAYEGGYVNDPADPGGETNFGISRRAYPQEDIRGMTRERAAEIYRRDYWDACRCDELPPLMAVAVFDCAVNQGVRRAVRLYQAVLRVQPDGVMGPQTIAQARAAGDRPLGLFLAERATAYATLVAHRPESMRFCRGWMRRLFALHERCLSP